MPSFDPTSVPLSVRGSTFVAVRFRRDLAGDDRFEFLPNVRVESYHIASGRTLASAQFSYIVDDTDPNTPFPFAWEQLWPLAATSPYVVQADDEILVYEFTAAGQRLLVFDGVAVIPQVNQAGKVATTFTAISVGVRLRDRVVGGAVMRDADTPQTSGNEVDTDLPTWFNPTVNGKTRPNRTPTGYAVHEGDPDAYHAFLDEMMLSPSGTTPATPDFWTLADFVTYLMWVYNSAEEWVKNPRSATGDSLADYLSAVTPEDGQTIDLTDPSTYAFEPIIIRSYDATGKAWDDAVEEQLGYYGFHLFLNTREDPDDPGAPLNEYIIYRVDGLDMAAPVELWYPPRGASLLDGLADFTGFAIGRDHHEPFNAVDVETAQVEYEASLILACGFSPDAADVSTPNNFSHSQLANASGPTRRKYRYFTFDSIGLGHWDFGGASFVTGQPGDLSPILGAEKDGVWPYVNRQRRGLQELLAIDSLGAPRKAELAISSDYAGAYPAVWDRTGTWRSLGASGWKLDDLDLAVWITCDNPESWHIPRDSTDPHRAGDVVRVISALAGADTSQRFWLRLTVRFKGDLGIDASAEPRVSSPLRFVTRRRIDARDHWLKQIAHESSVYNTTGKPIIVRDDTAKARAHAESLRFANEFPAVAGSVSIPWINHSIGVGDLISRINGRDVDLNTAAAGPVGEGPRYPAVVSVSYTCQNPQTTTLKLTDRRAEIEAAAHGYGGPRS